MNGSAAMLNFYQLEQTIEAAMGESFVPGLALAIVYENQLLYAKGFGVTSVEDGGVAVTPETLFRIGSVTKPLTGTLIMRLVEEGKLDLDVPIKAYIDWLRFSNADASKHVTLRMLLSHTSGLVTDGQHFGWRDPQGLEVFVREQIPAYTFVAPPGTEFSYSNPGVNLAGYVAEVVCGKPYVELMQEKVFEPLQMRRTTFDTTVAMTYALAQPHTLDKNRELRVQHRYPDNVAHNPSGFAISTIADMANFVIMQMQQGKFQGRQLLSADSIREMHKVQTRLYTIDEQGYGLTFFYRVYKGLQQIWHDGGISTFVCRLALMPERGAAVIMMFNRQMPAYETIAQKIFDDLLDLPKQEPAFQVMEPDRSLWDNYTGTYLGAWRGVATITAEGDHLQLRRNGTVLSIQCIGENLYVGHAADGQVVSVGFPNDDGPGGYVYINGYGYRRVELTTEPQPELWPSYEGVYAIEGLDTYTVRVVEDELHIYSKVDDAEMKLTPIDVNRFGGTWGIFEFLVDNKGDVMGLKQGPTWIYERI
jgi:CubicO group peptidase (beta-lactamase class C family)